MKTSFKAAIVIILQTTILFAQTPVERNGKLKVVGLQLSTENGSPVQLRGLSSHGPQWTSGCLEQSAFDTLRKDWGSDIFRIAMYVEENGYLSDSVFFKEFVDTLVERIGRSGMYCLIDWHILSDGNPMKHLTQAKSFWDYMSKKHSGKKHVLYEICNEPNGPGVTWDVIKQYAEIIIPIIRKNDSSSVIMVGTPNWSGQPWTIVGKELKGQLAENVMYSFHFYAATHAGYLPDIKETVSKLPVFVTEWGGVLSSGKGQFDAVTTDRFMDIFNGNNSAGVMVSWCNWSFSDVDEGSSVLKPYSCRDMKWNQTSRTGDIIKEMMRTPDLDPACISKTQIFQSPRSIISKPGKQTYFISRATCPNVDYQWQYSADSITWTDIIGKNTFILSLEPIKQNDKGFYRTIMSQAGDTLITKAASLKFIIDGPFLGYPLAVPGRIEAEHYDEGDSQGTYSDSDPGNNGGALRIGDVDIESTKDSIGSFNVGWTEDFEFLAYSIDVKESGFYDMFFRVASDAVNPGVLAILVNDVVELIPGVSIEPTGDWQKWKTIRVSNLPLSKGLQNMKLYFLKGSINVNYIDVLVHNPTGIEDEVYNKNFSVYPNPGSDNIWIKSLSAVLGAKSIEVYNSVGIKVLQHEITSQEIVLDVSALAQGVYTLKIAGEEKSQNLKWIKR